MSFTEIAPKLLELVFVRALSDVLRMNAAWSGGGRLISLLNINTTSDMLGLAVADSCTHNRAIWIHL